MKLSIDFGACYTSAALILDRAPIDVKDLTARIVAAPWAADIDVRALAIPESPMRASRHTRVEATYDLLGLLGLDMSSVRRDKDSAADNPTVDITEFNAILGGSALRMFCGTAVSMGVAAVLTPLRSHVGPTR